MKIGERLCEAGVLRPTQLEVGLAHAEKKGMRVGSALIELGLIAADHVADALAQAHGVPAAHEEDFAGADSALAKEVPLKIAKRNLVFPVKLSADRKELWVVVATPQDVTVLDELAFAISKKLHIMVASQWRIQKALIAMYGEDARFDPTASGTRKISAPMSATTDPTASASFKISGLMPAADASSVRKASTSAVTVPMAAEEPGLDSLQEFADQKTVLDPPKTLPGSDSTTPTLTQATITLPSVPPPKRGTSKFAWVALGVTAVAAGLFYRSVLADQKEAVRGRPVKGDFRSTHVGLTLDIPDNGWQLLRREDHSGQLAQMNTRTSMFFRGESAEHPEAILLLSSMVSDNDFPEETTEEQFAMLVKQIERGITRQPLTRFIPRKATCKPVLVKDSYRGECTGFGEFGESEYDLKAFTWIESTNTAVLAMFATNQGQEFLKEDIRAILPTIAINEVK